MPRNKPSMPNLMETSGFGWRVGLSILVVFGWAIFAVIWLLYYGSNLSVYQNVAAILAALLVGVAILAASWAPWGMRYGWKHREEWKQGRYSEEDCNCGHKHNNGAGGAVYGLGFVGALIYYVTTAPNVWIALIGVVKAIFWPAFIVYGALKLLGM